MIDFEKVTGSRAVEIRPLSGGCIANSQYVCLANGQELFWKSGKLAQNTFKTEALALQDISLTKTIRVPKVLYVDHENLCLEYICQGKEQEKSASLFGKKLAALNLHSASEFGWVQNNYIGATTQINTWERDWTTFFTEHRLQFQFDLLKSVSKDFENLFYDFKEAVKNIINSLRSIQPGLIHGDLWSGNYFYDEQGEPVIFDPATYYGHPEMELAMTTLFGGFSKKFYEAYTDTYPLEEGWQERLTIYKVYHLLNHINLFGSSYLSQTQHAMKQVLRN